MNLSGFNSDLLVKGLCGWQLESGESFCYAANGTWGASALCFVGRPEVANPGAMSLTTFPDMKVLPCSTMLYDSATNQNLCMSSEIKRPALLSTYWPIKLSGHQDHIKMIKLISFCREKNATKAQQDLELCCPSAPFVGLHGTLQMHDGTDGVGLGYHGRNQKPVSHLQKMGV